MQPMPAMTKEMTMAGPACCAAARPVSTKMPVPMMPPMPKAISDGMPRARTRRLVGSLLVVVRDRLGGEHPFDIHVMNPA